MLKHSKVSGVANAGAAVGGADWDAAHVWPLGSVFPLALITLTWDGTTWAIQKSSRVSTLSEIDPGHFDCVVDLSNLSIQSGRTRSIFIRHSMALNGSWPAGWRFYAVIDSLTGDLSVFVENDMGGSANPPFASQFFVDVLVAVN